MEIKAKKVKLYLNFGKSISLVQDNKEIIKRPCNVSCLEIDYKRWKLENCRLFNAYLEANYYFTSESVHLILIKPNLKAKLTINASGECVM